MKKILLLSFLFVSANLCAEPVSIETALQVARNFYLQNLHQQDPTTATRYEFTLQQEVATSDGIPLYYVVDVEAENGFVLVAGTNAAEPVFGYATTGKYVAENQIESLSKWMENYKAQLRYIVENQLNADEHIARKWQGYLSGELVEQQSESSVEPLLTTTWNQSPHYNAQCPYDYNYSQFAVTGCVATAMAQIMKYWNYPAQGTGYHEYFEGWYGTLSANFAATTYNWSAMPNNVTSNNDAVATLMYHCGVSVNMDYGIAANGGSSAWVISDDSPNCAENAYKTYFGYNSSTIQGVQRSAYTDSQWSNTLKNELNVNRPIQYAGFGGGSGHTWVCDGYDNNDWFHMNWGWGGNSDGYFEIDYLNPGALGTGGGTGGYNSGHQAVIGIQPPSGGGGGTGSSIDMEMYSDIYVYPDPIEYGQSFTVNANITNYSSSTFYGDITAALFDADFNFVDYIETLTESNGLPSNYHYTNGLDFSTSGLSAPPGDYYIGIFVFPNGGDEWYYVQDGWYENLIPVNIVYYNDIEMYSDITMGSSVLTQNQAATFNYDVANFSGYDFYGSLSIDLHDFDGNWLQTIDQYDNVDLCNNCHFTDGIDFTTNGLDVDPGTYIVAAWEYEDWSGWRLVGSTTNYNNPIYADIVVPPLSPDSYESNNTEGSASTLTINFTGSNANKKTSNANIHVGNDYDYYKINLPTGYNYNITARAQDSYNSNDGQTYTDDVLWSYKIGNEVWSDAYDDVMANTIYVPNGGLVKFHLAPYFQGQTGTYAFEMNITRTLTTGIDQVTAGIPFQLYPNPTNGIVFVQTNEPLKATDKLNLYNSTGQLIQSYTTASLKNKQLDLTNLKGIYFLELISDKGIFTQKLIVK